MLCKRSYIEHSRPCHPHAIKDETEPYLAKPVKDHVKDYKGNRNWTYRSRHFSEIVLTKGLYCRRKGKRYAMEAVIIAELDDLKGIKDNLGRAQS